MIPGVSTGIKTFSYYPALDIYRVLPEFASDHLPRICRLFMDKQD